MLIIILSLLFFLIDQVIKILVISNMNLYETIPIINNLFNMTYIHNSGVVFGFFQNNNLNILFIIVCFLAIFFVFMRKDIVKFYNDNKFSILFKVAVSLLLGGGFGNIFDRIYRGYVIDFFDLKYFAVFNFADIFISIAFIFFIYFFYKEKFL